MRKQRVYSRVAACRASIQRRGSPGGDGKKKNSSSLKSSSRARSLVPIALGALKTASQGQGLGKQGAWNASRTHGHTSNARCWARVAKAARTSPSPRPSIKARARRGRVGRLLGAFLFTMPARNTQPHFPSPAFHGGAAPSVFPGHPQAQGLIFEDAIDAPSLPRRPR